MEKVIRWRLLGLFLASVWGLGWVLTGQPNQVEAHYNKREVRIPMRDGVTLFTAVYEPKDRAGTYPILLTRTPYSIAPYGEANLPDRLGPSPEFDKEGFIYVFQDVRGRNMSEGVWQEMTPQRAEHNSTKDIDESTDCYDTIEWLLKKIANNNGKVGLLGISYPGFYTSAGMIDAHPALVAASPQAPVSDLYNGDDAYHNGALFLLANFMFYADFAPQTNPLLPEPDKSPDFGTKDGYRFFLRMRNVERSERFFHRSNPYWTETYRNTTYDEYWKARNILPHLHAIRPAVLLVGGWHDAEDLSGTVKTYRALREQSPETELHLAMGPWSHGGWEDRGTTKLGNISFGDGVTIFFQDQIELPFFRHLLKSGPDPHLPPAWAFRTGDNHWIQCASWPPPNLVAKRFFLHNAGRLDNVEPTEAEPPDEYESDPSHPVPFFETSTMHMNREYMDADQRFVAARPDVRSFQTAPLQEDLVLAGPVKAFLHVATSGTDSDFDLKLIDVHPEPAGNGSTGYQELIRGEPFRAKFRHGFEQPEPMPPGKQQRLNFNLPDVYHCFRKGHRLMVQIQSSWFPLTDRNPQTFTDIPTANSSQFRIARQQIFHDAQFSSFIEVLTNQ